MTKKGRLDKLYPGLTAQERALLVLQAWKEGTDEDPQARKTMPSSQVDEFNRYIEAGDLAKTTARIEKIRAESDDAGGFVGMYL